MERRSDPVLRKLEAARKELLGTTKRVRLINTPRHKPWVKTIEVVDELSDEVFAILVERGRKMSFLPHPDLGEDEDEVPADQLGLLQQPGDGDQQSDAADRHRDNKLQTKLSSRKLQSRLLALFRDSQTLLDEQGTSTLYLALGFLRWFESADSEQPLHSPLILLPVELERKGANQAFKIKFSGDELWSNLPLQRRLLSEHQIELPDLDGASLDSPSTYFGLVESTIAGLERWEVLCNDIVLGVFRFQKLLMYLDLDPSRWPEGQKVNEHELVRGYLGEGFDGASDGDEAKAAAKPRHDERLYILPADSSQAEAIEAVKKGANLVIQGPPGTGKSQTITNLIASAVDSDKRVLFLSQKRAALDVVYESLRTLGLDAVCLELHSHKARKKRVLAELERTLALELEPSQGDWSEVSKTLDEISDERSALLRELHGQVGNTARSPHSLSGELVELRLQNFRSSDWALPEGVEDWSEEEYQRALEIVGNLQRRTVAIGSPKGHAWRGTCLTTVLPSEMDRIQALVGGLGDFLERCLEALDRFKEHTGGWEPQTWADIDSALRMAELVAQAPEVDLRALAAEVWEQKRDALSTVVGLGRSLSAAKAELAPVLDEGAWAEDWDSELRVLRTHSGSLLKWFKGEYRAARQKVKGFLVGRSELSFLEIVGILVEAQRAGREIDSMEAIALAAFGTNWEGSGSDFQLLDAILAWEGSVGDLGLSGGRQIAAALGEWPGLQEGGRQLRKRRDEALHEVETLLERLEFDVASGFEEEKLSALSLDALRKRVSGWQDGLLHLEEWCAYRLAAREAAALGLAEFVRRVGEETVHPEKITDTFRYSILEHWLEKALRERPLLSKMDSAQLKELVDSFRELDERHRRLAVNRVADSHLGRVPRGSAQIGEVGVIRREANKKRRHLPIRQLFGKAGSAVQAIKPVFMMSPLSVAQFLEPGVVDFDLLLIDEASQLPPEDALGAIARSRQIVVVGDDKQLPPTRFFDRLDQAEDSDIDDSVADLESILGLSTSVGLFDKMLRWHYRSRHESLIAVSNSEFYDHRLFVVPSAAGREDGLGLCLERVEGIYERGRTSANPNEARCVAEAVINHAHERPDLSLGVATFSIRQRDEVLDHLELLRREDPRTESFFSGDGIEPFFVKNLESVQGDERDVIFISIGYGPDESGYLTMNFGPLGKKGGERRLNVLISRAKYQCVVFSSIDAAQIDLARARSRGAQVLKSYLHYAEGGDLDLPELSGGEVESPFEAAVARSLRGLGYKIDTQVGVSGFRIDLAVRDPEVPGRYLLAIECDGATYHSSRSARDRDVLREQVLRDRGWEVVRVWSTDWLNHPQEQLKRLKEAIETARARGPSPPAARGSGPRAAPKPVYREVEAGFGAGDPATQSTPYREAVFSVSGSAGPHEVGATRLLKEVLRILQIERSIHQEELARRVATVWGLKRAGSRILDATRSAVRLGRASGELSVEDGFVQLPELAEVPPRDRSEVASTTLRKSEYLPPLEVSTTLLRLVGEHRGVEREEAIVETARLLGFKRTGDRLRRVIAKRLDALVESGKLAVQGGRLDLEA